MSCQIAIITTEGLFEIVAQRINLQFTDDTDLRNQLRDMSQQISKIEFIQIISIDGSTVFTPHMRFRHVS